MANFPVMFLARPQVQHLLPWHPDVPGSIFFRVASAGSHSQSQRCQKRRTSSWIRRHCFRMLNCVESTNIGANWSGLGSRVYHPLGLLFDMSRNVSDKSLSSNYCSHKLLVIYVCIPLNSTKIACFADFIMASCTPPKCGASGVIKCH